MTDVINKAQAKELYKTLRSLTAKGATIICLAHTNKYTGEDGYHVFEGTGDLRADVDEMIFFVPRKNEDGSMTVSTRPDKVRGAFKPITFEISADREVRLRDDYVNVQAEQKVEDERTKECGTIDLITELLSEGAMPQSELVAKVRDKDPSIGRNRVLKVLCRWSNSPGELWEAKRLSDRNMRRYSLL